MTPERVTRRRRRVGVALLVDGAAGWEVQGLRRALGDRSLTRIDPHVTLVAPLNLRQVDLPAALSGLRRAAAAAPRRLELVVGPVRTFAPANPVLYLEVGGDLSALRTLRAAVYQPPLQRPTQWPWVPHVTVADEAHAIPEALACLGSFRLEVAVDRLVLLELRDDRWDPLADVALGPPSRVGVGGRALELTESRMVDPEAAELWRSGGAGPVPGGFPVSSPTAEVGQVTGNLRLVVTARRDATVCGVAAAWVEDDGAHLAVFVDPAQRGEGTGRHLVAAVEAALNRAGWSVQGLAAHGPAAFYAAVSARARVYSKATDA